MIRIILILLIFVNPLWADTEIYFTGQDNVEAKIIEKIDKAEYYIDIAMYGFTNQALLEALESANKRKVSVRIILDKLQSHGRYALTEDIMKDRIKWNTKIMRGFNGGIMHNKICIIDDKYLLTGSYNWTQGAEHRNHENLVIIDDIDIIQQALEYYQELWRK